MGSPSPAREGSDPTGYVRVYLPVNQLRMVAKFRLCCWPLEVNKGHHRPRECRTCQVCTSGKVEDEYHVLMECEAYTELRNRFLINVEDTDMRKVFLNTNPRKIATFLTEVFDERQQRALEPHGSPWHIGQAPARARSFVEMKYALPSPVLPSFSEVDAANRGLKEACPLYTLPGFDPSKMIQYDAMHTIGGVIKDVVVLGIQGLRAANASDTLVEYDSDNNIQTKTAGVAGSEELSRFRAALSRIAISAPTWIGSRLKRLTAPNKKAKTHTFFLLAGPVGVYAVSCMRLSQRKAEQVYVDLLHACCDLWDKVQMR
ncbi:hypothetical protein VOLCADRAFT_108607 [Volvox carteri f. nagariensis]|uniref:Uncharacterized protein n=1 Tax=Volvox carteri f. nagariensis TaxID=3068 RepID=D8UL78_VOLCA|nr:uncharacterized protein VOLCADRAFT_108607 [Volvox carteri f. nagariensis]EFJ39521.1 hypothetical protein VOLCADRAFT_108607 [Volvox carteri f. nagariensis]|eukprot:XP_002959414.1 hypothetical protein VOLCADRAFT_108607 [Volvox carteri f. nagariensis]